MWAIGLSCSLDSIAQFRHLSFFMIGILFLGEFCLWSWTYYWTLYAEYLRFLCQTWGGNLGYEIQSVLFIMTFLWVLRGRSRIVLLRICSCSLFQISWQYWARYGIFNFFFHTNNCYRLSWYLLVLKRIFNSVIVDYGYVSVVLAHTRLSFAVVDCPATLPVHIYVSFPPEKPE